MRGRGFALTCYDHTLYQQGHLDAAEAIGDIYYWGKGVTIDYARAMAAYKVGAEGGNAVCQYMVGYMHKYGQGVAVDYKQALPWLEKAVAQDSARGRPELHAHVASAVGVAAGGDGRRDRDAAGGDGSGERGIGRASMVTCGGLRPHLL